MLRISSERASLNRAQLRRDIFVRLADAIPQSGSPLVQQLAASCANERAESPIRTIVVSINIPLLFISVALYLQEIQFWYQQPAVAIHAKWFKSPLNITFIY